MLIASIVAIIISLMATSIIARILYLFTKRKQNITKKDYILNGIIVGLSFFCISTFIYISMMFFMTY